MADIYDFHRLVRVKEHEDRTVRYMEKWDKQKRRKPGERLDIRKKVLFIAECLKKKDVPGVFYNSDRNQIIFQQELELIMMKQTIIG